MGISENKSDIRWRITLQQNLTSTIAALVHYERPSSVNRQKRVNFDPQNKGLVWVNIWHPIVKFGTQLIYLELWEIQKFKFTHTHTHTHTHTFRKGQVLFPGMKFFSPRGCSGGRSSVNLGPPHISETTRARKLKFYTRLDETKYFFRYENFYARGVRGHSTPSVNLGLSPLWGTLLCQTPKARELWPQNEGLVWVNIWHPS